ncbi:MAG: UvrD-helicase domain-containing protein [Bacilli bacterium]|nr:UvrD-helicase domain-containing protein [Bacilli bacterium]
MPTWTKEQQQAIDLDNSNIIVSAGAGSGKTAVLSERVIRKIKDGIDVDKLLVLTFTNAAAAEMKIRIRKKIISNNMKEQLSKLDSSYITTFDSFALSLVKKYCIELNVSRDLSIVDNSIINIEKKKILEEILEEKYQEKDNDFLKLIRDFCNKDDDNIKKTILSLSKKIDMRYDKDEYLNTYLETFYNDNYIENIINEYVKVILNYKDIIETLLEDLQHYLEEDQYQKYYDLIINLVYAKTYDDISKNINFKLPNTSSKYEDEAKEIIRDIKKYQKLIQEKTFLTTEEEIKQSINSTYPYKKTIINIIKELDKRITSFKYKNNIFEFVDISKMAIKLVKEFKDVKEEIKNYFNEIMIDEYQDTNDLQEEFIKEIENNNIYMVGDIKQSIYRFRNANPNIFKEKYDKYSNNINGHKIDLNKNFRSRKEVLDNINTIFDLIMDNNLGGAEYKESHRMVFGNNTYIEEGNSDQNNDIEIYNYDPKGVENFSKEEIEAFIIANDIKEKINNNYQIFDKDSNPLILRKAKYDDFVIIMDRGKDFPLYKKIFEYMQIPLTIINDQDLTDQDNIYIISNIIKFILKIKNKKYDDEFKYSFISIARSYIYEYSDQYIYDVIKENRYFETSIYKDLNEISSVIDYLSNKELIQNIIDKLDIYNKLLKLPNMKENTICLEMILEFASSTSTIGYTKEMLSECLKEMLDTEEKIKYSLNIGGGDSVKIINIHKSKGLEYHICYFSGFYKTFNLKELNDRFLYDNQYGIISPYFNNGIGDTIEKSLLKDKYVKEEVGEKLRLFYVALTRSMEKMIIVLPSRDKESITISNDIVDNDIRENYKSFLDIIESIASRISNYKVDVNLDNIEITKDYDKIKSNNFDIKSINKKIITDILELPIEEEKTEKFSKKISILKDKKIKENINFGNYIHYILETIDLTKKEINLDIDPFIKNKIIKFLNNPLLENITESKIIKEYEFIYTEEDTIKHGIIDLILEYKDQIDIIDYKLKEINDNNYINQLKGYKNYIENKMNKKTNIYLYSILDEIVNKI